MTRIGTTVEAKGMRQLRRRLSMLDKEFDDDDEMGEDVELEVPAEDKFTNDLDPAEKK